MPRSASSSTTCSSPNIDARHTDTDHTMNFNVHDLMVLLPEDFLLGATCAILLIDLFIKPAQRGITHWLSIATLLVTAALVLVDKDPATVAFSGAYIHDGVAAVLKVFILGVTAAVLVFAKNYMT